MKDTNVAKKRDDKSNATGISVVPKVQIVGSVAKLGPNHLFERVKHGFSRQIHQFQRGHYNIGNLIKNDL